jgi:hypothetical protein
MASTLFCRLSKADSGGYRISLTLPDGRNFERFLADTDLARLTASGFPSPPVMAGPSGADFFNSVFGGAEPMIFDIIAQAPAQPDRLARVLLEIADRELDYLPWELAMLGTPGQIAFEVVRSVPVSPQLAGKVPTLPFRVMVANMGAPHEETPTFPLRSVLLRTFDDPERLTKVFHPTTLAGIGRDELIGVLSQSRYEIVHLQVLTDWLDARLGMIAAPSEGPPLVGSALLPLLQRAQTRLLILHLRRTPDDPEQARQLLDIARDIVEGGGPAVFVVPFDHPDPGGGTVMLNRLYDQIVHDQPLDAAVHLARVFSLTTQMATQPWLDWAIPMRPTLMLGQDAENLLRISPVAVDLLERTRSIRQRVLALSHQLQRLNSQTALDLTGTSDILVNAQGMFDRAERIALDIKDWQSESRGLMPLYDAVQAADQGSRELERVEPEIERAEESSARVVNVSFVGSSGYVPGDEPLLLDAIHWLRLQISGPWGTRSIVRNPRPLPDHYLDAHSDATGIYLDVCVYTEDFLLPGGDAFPLWLPRAPAASNHLDIAVIPKSAGIARLRLCVYYSYNLVQSLAVVALVSTGPITQVEAANYAEVEFSMADTLLGIELLPPRTINLLTNDNGDGTHKIVIHGPGIKLEYTVTGSRAITDARKTLLAICADVDKEGRPTKYHYSDDDNSGDEHKLIADLKELADLGRTLYGDLITDPANWAAEDPLEQALKQPGEIQISVTHAARIIYPWALLYDRKLESGPGTVVCPLMLEKLAGPGQPDYRINSCLDGGCPHTSDLKTICPLGFWGFRHAIEQLPPNQGRVVDEIVTHRPPIFFMAVHQELEGKLHRAEIEKKAELTADYYDLKAAISTAVRATHPHVVYFYCHGGHDARVPWLGVGDGEQIIPDDFRAWETNKHWRTTTPLVVVNGCHTVDLTPDDLLDFVKVFAWSQAAGIIGTEIAIPQSLAREFGRYFMRRFVNGRKVAEILRDFRLTLLAKRNLLGLAYTPYCRGDLHLVLN